MVQIGALSAGAGPRPEALAGLPAPSGSANLALIAVIFWQNDGVAPGGVAAGAK
jgi:hypothetical protein